MGRKHLPKLNDALRTYVVMRLAGYDSPSEIVRSLKDDFGIDIRVSSIEGYDPTGYRAERCPERWAMLFHETRARIIAGQADIGAAHKMVRVRWLDQMARRQMVMQNSAEARALLKQVAEEMGQLAEQRHDGSGAAYGELGMAELKARIVAAAAKLRLAFVPLGAPAAAGGDGAAGEPQPPGEPVSG